MPENKDDNNLASWLGFPKNPGYRNWRLLGRILGCVLAFVFFTALFISAIQFFVAAFGASNSSTIHADARNYALILAALLSIPFVIWRVLIAQKQADIAEQGLITDRITKAVEQLGAGKTMLKHIRFEGQLVFQKGESGEADYSKPFTVEETVPNLEVRIGAIYALERIAQDSIRDHIPVMEILCAYVRNNSPVSTDRETVSIDIQTVLTVIGRRSSAQKRVEAATKAHLNTKFFKLDLRETNLQNVDMSGYDFSYCRFMHANLTGANFHKAKLYSSNLRQASLQGADLIESDLRWANLCWAKFDGVSNLLKSKLDFAAVQGANFEEVEMLTQSQIASMFGDYTTRLPEKISQPDWAKNSPHFWEFAEDWLAAKKAANL